MDVYLGVALAFCATVVALVLLIPSAGRLGLLEAPGGHRSHPEPTAAVGGLAMFFGLVLGFLALPQWSATTQYYLSGAALLVLTGHLDDRRLIPIGFKAVGQIMAAGLLVIGGQVVIRNMGNLLGLGDISLGWLAVPFTIFAIVGLINAINMMDGMDGMAGSISLSITLMLLYLAYTQGGIAPGSILVCTGAIAGFLCFNLRLGERRARTFMGDTGSMLLGYTLAWFVILVSQEPAAVLPPMAVLWIVIVPVMDTFRLMVWRVIMRQSPFDADNQHLHHILVQRGWPVNVVVVAACVATLAASAAAFYISRFAWADPVLFYGFAAIFVLYFVCALGSARIRKRPQDAAAANDQALADSRK